MRRALLVLLCAGTVCCLEPQPGPAAVTPPPPPATVAAAAPAAPKPPGASYPLPPRQGAPWVAPATSVPAPVVAATKALFGEGMADPRGCAYREIEIAVGDVWSGGGKPIATHGWVLPGEAFAVAWNGLVYRVASAGAPADVGVDVKAALDADAEARAKEQRDNPGSEFHRFPSIGEAGSVSATSMNMLKVPMLLRLGEGALAARFLKAYGDEQLEKHPYVSLATRWVWARYDRAVTAHMRGDDGLALESLRPLPRIARAVEEELAALHEAPARQRAAGPYPHLSFLAHVDVLLADQERRARAPEAKVDLAAVQKLPEPQRIAALVAALDQVSARQWGQPGGVSLAEDPIVRALVAEGEPAVEPLLAVLEKDTRLTRSVHFWRDFAMQRSVLGVHEAAYTALATILQTSAFEPAATGDDLSARGMEGRREVARKLRALYEKWKGVPVEQRWYRTLADDSAKPEAWLDAAERITQPTNVTVYPSSMVFTTSVTTAPSPGKAPALRGETLRKETAPSVSSLMARRAASMKDVGRSCAMALDLARWDAHAALPTLARETRRAVAASRGPGKIDFGACIAALSDARADAKDASALADYARWVVTTTPRGDLGGVTRFFEPMWLHPSDPAIVRAAGVVFGPHSAWLPIVPTHAVTQGDAYEKVDLLESRLLEVPAFRRYVLGELGNRTQAGTVRMKSGGGISVDMIAGWSTGTSAEKGDPLTPPEGTEYPVRVCDYVAWILSSRQGAPRFQLYWPKDARDAALGATAGYLRAIK